jgi:hypothetical protein
MSTDNYLSANLSVQTDTQTDRAEESVGASLKGTHRQIRSAAIRDEQIDRQIRQIPKADLAP